MNWPSVREGNGENDSNCSRLDHGAESFMEIKPLLLMKSLSHQASFVFVDGTIGIVLYPKHLFAACGLSVGRKWHQSLGDVFQQS